ncbi:hypothetical protein [Silvibacterium bohemicum]|nr:hypothetical protein [Silvibacterium bohemicum]
MKVAWRGSCTALILTGQDQFARLSARGLKKVWSVESSLLEYATYGNREQVVARLGIQRSRCCF